MYEISWDYLKKGIKEQPDLNGKDIVLWGADSIGLDLSICDYITKNEMGNSICFCDNDRTKWGTKRYGITVKSPKEIQEVASPYAIICTSDLNRSDVEVQLDNMGIKHICLFEYIFENRKNHFFDIYNNYLHDEESKRTFLTLLLCHISGKYELTKEIFSGNQYFVLPECVTRKKILIDCGAFVGDIVEKFIYENDGIFKNIYAFEPCKRQFNAMEIRTERLKQEWALNDSQIELVKKAIGDKTETLHFALLDTIAGNHATHNDIGSEEVESTSLDEFFKDKELNDSVMIKADIEGQELNMLKGAEHIIKTYHPKLAICIYHNPKDFFEIPEYIHSLVPEYKMFIRHHSYNEYETVLYCCV